MNYIKSLLYSLSYGISAFGDYADQVVKCVKKVLGKILAIRFLTHNGSVSDHRIIVNITCSDYNYQ